MDRLWCSVVVHHNLVSHLGDDVVAGEEGDSCFSSPGYPFFAHEVASIEGDSIMPEPLQDSAGFGVVRGDSDA